jgi:membrane-associated protein
MLGSDNPPGGVCPECPRGLASITPQEVASVHVGFDLVELIKAVGYIGLFLIVFAESGLLIGFFLPGDSLLFTAGFLASPATAAATPDGQPFLNIYLLVPLIVVAAITGDSVGYWFGHRVGRRLYDRPDSRFFKRKHLLAAEAFYEKHGGKTIVLARFLPFVRTFAPIVAGTARMDYGRFLFFNVAGGLLWGAGLPIAGYFLGSIIPDVDKYLIPIILLIIALSILPTAIHLLKNHRQELLELVPVRFRRGLVPAKADDAKE